MLAQCELQYMANEFYGDCKATKAVQVNLEVQGTDSNGGSKHV